MGSKTYKVGDVVQLKSGGPRLTVTELQGNGLLRCAWFATGHPERLCADDFPPDALKPLSDNE